MKIKEIHKKDGYKFIEKKLTKEPIKNITILNKRNDGWLSAMITFKNRMKEFGPLKKGPIFFFKIKIAY
jgi:hypothetical protein